MTSETRLTAMLAVALLVGGAVRPALAESHAAEDVTPAALVRGSDAVVVVTRVGPEPGRPEPGLRVDEVLFGTVPSGSVVGARDEDGRRALVVEDGFRGVAALVRTGDGGWGLRGGALGLLPEAAEGEPTAALFRELATLLRGDGATPEPARFRAALVAAVDGAPSRVRAGAALDLVRESVDLASASEGERAALQRAFDRVLASDASRPFLATALLRTGAPGGPMADAVAMVGGLHIAEAVGAALGERDDGEALRRLAAASASTTPAVRRSVARALGASRHAAARPGLLPLLADGDAAVRREAILGLGLHRAPDAASALLRRFQGDGTPSSAERDADLRRALCWALAQCDEPSAWEALRRTAEGDEDTRVRAEAEAVLRNPRRSWVR